MSFSIPSRQFSSIDVCSFYEVVTSKLHPNGKSGSKMCIERNPITLMDKVFYNNDALNAVEFLESQLNVAMCPYASLQQNAFHLKGCATL